MEISVPKGTRTIPVMLCAGCSGIPSFCPSNINNNQIFFTTPFSQPQAELFPRLLESFTSPRGSANDFSLFPFDWREEGSRLNCN